jgi:hypothetical protein
MLGSGCWVLDTGYWMLAFWFKVQGRLDGVLERLSATGCFPLSCFLFPPKRDALGISFFLLTFHAIEPVPFWRDDFVITFNFLLFTCPGMVFVIWNFFVSFLVKSQLAGRMLLLFNRCFNFPGLATGYFFDQQCIRPVIGHDVLQFINYVGQVSMLSRAE